jgi:hypothetical protein
MSPQYLVNQQVNRFVTGNLIDLHGRRIVNAGDAVDTQDYVTLNQLNNVVQAPNVIIQPTLNWLPLILQSGWTQYTLTFAPACTITTQGLLQFCGSLKLASFTNGAVAALLPLSNMYPSAVLTGVCSVYDITTGGYGSVGEFYITTTGQFKLFSNATAGHNIAFFIDGLCVRIH